MASFEQDGFSGEDDELGSVAIDVFDLSPVEAGNVFANQKVMKTMNDVFAYGHCRSINGLLVFTMREFPGLVVDLLSTNNFVVRLTRMLISSSSSLR